jgi:hypothetical protein
MNAPQTGACHFIAVAKAQVGVARPGRWFAGSCGQKIQFFQIDRSSLPARFRAKMSRNCHACVMHLIDARTGRYFMTKKRRFDVEAAPVQLTIDSI